MSEPHVKTTIEIGDAKITFEGPAAFVEAQAQKFLSARKTQDAPPLDSSNIKSQVTGGTERELVEKKAPRNHSETVAVLAYFLREKGTAEFDEADIRRAYLRAGVRPPKAVAQALRDAKNKFDLLETGESRGKYRLSPHGENTVLFDLPGDQT